MIERENIFAKGGNSLVRKPSIEERTMFTHAQLVREEFKNIKDMARISFYRHKIASTLFPGHFIEVVGVTSTPNAGAGGRFEIESTTPNIYKNPVLNRLYSVLSRVSPDHATYTSHMGFQVQDGLDFGAGGKKFECTCIVCQRHHRQHGLITTLKASLLSRRFDLAGIEVPTDDQTDFCDVNGKLVFFEVNWVDPEKVKEYIASQKNLPESTKRRVSNLAERLAQLHDGLSFTI